MANKNKALILLQIIFCICFAANIPSRPDVRPISTKDIIAVTGTFGEVRSSGESAKPHIHTGIDWACLADTQVLAPGDGVVVESRYEYGYGNYIKIKHEWIKDGKPYTVYSIVAHINEFLILKGAKVKKGQPIALSGNTGRSVGAHLHYELRNEQNAPIWNGTYQAERLAEEK